MGLYVVIWKQEMEDGSVGILDTSFTTQEEVERHIRKLQEDAKTLGKPFELVSVTDLSQEKIVPRYNRKYAKRGRGWHGDSRRHSMARRGIKTKGK